MHMHGTSVYEKVFAACRVKLRICPQEIQELCKCTRKACFLNNRIHFIANTRNFRKAEIVDLIWADI